MMFILDRVRRAQWRERTGGRAGGGDFEIADPLLGSGTMWPMPPCSFLRLLDASSVLSAPQPPTKASESGLMGRFVPKTVSYI